MSNKLIKKMMDNQGQQKDIIQNNTNGNDKPVSILSENPIDYFAKDQSFVFVYKKTEKLATATYMVTNLFGDNEPMKWSLRTKVSQLLSFIIGFKDVLESREYEFSDEVKTKVLEVVSLLEVASRSGLVSNMNYSILKTEFMNLLNGLSSLKKSTEERAEQTLPKSFFDIHQVNIKSQGHNQSRVTEGYMQQDGKHKGQESSEKEIMSFKNTASEYGEPKKTNRQSIIINLLKKKKDLTIKDIALVIKDCSEKTIQRELINLINTGVLKKTGERRWSRYSLVLN
ncbi:MAG: hypothetical protein ACYCZW_01740 [Minisyncoccota bacterium]